MLIGLIFIVALMFISNILQIGERLNRLNPSIELVFYIVIAVVFYFLIINPVIQVLAAPSFTVKEILNKDAGGDWKFYKKIARNLIKNGELKDEEMAKLKYAIIRGSDLKDVLTDLFETSIKLDINKIIVDDAQKVMIITGISQSNKMDFITMISINFKMIKRLVSRCGFRPSFSSLVKLYVNIFSTVLLAEGIEELDVKEILPVLGDSSIMKIPGLPLVFDSIAQGFSNAFFTLRIGIITRNYIFSEGKEITKAIARKSAFKEATLLMKPLVKNMVKLAPEEFGIIKNQFEKIFG